MQSMEDSFQTSDLFDYVTLALLSLDTRGQQSLGLGNPQSLRGEASSLNLAGLPPAPLPELSLLFKLESARGSQEKEAGFHCLHSATVPSPSQGISGPGKLAQICLLQGHAGDSPAVK